MSTAGQIVKSFKACPFRIMLPSISVSNGNLFVNFDLRRQVGNKTVFAFISAEAAFPTGKKVTSRQEELVTETMLRKTIYVSMSNVLSSAYALNVTISIKIIAANGSKYRVCYSVGKSNQTALQYIQIEKSSPEETRLLSDLQNVLADNTRNNSKEPEAERSNTRYEKPDSKEVLNADLDLIEYTGFVTSELAAYAKTLYRERCFLRKEGGRKYKVTEGIRISSPPSSDGYVYSFVMEAELYIADDAPLRLFLPGKTVEGKAVFSEEFLLIVQFPTDLGKEIATATFQVEPWRLLDAQYKKLQELKDNDHAIAMQLLNEGPALSTAHPVNDSNIRMGQAAAENHARQEAVTVIWGPPGTGKTYTMAKIAISALKKGQSVLIVSHSNISVDGAIKKVAELLRAPGNNTAALRAGKVLRYGYVRDAELAEDSEAVAYNYILKSRPELKKREESLRKEKAALKGAFRTVENEKKKYAIEKELKRIRAEVGTYVRQISYEARILATTVSKLTMDDLFKDKRYDVVMFDEISMAYVTQVLCAAMFAEKHFICVGDFRQLAPIVQSEAKAVLEKDLFSFLHILVNGKVYAHPWLVMLNEQRRMHPAISRYSNIKYYDGRLKDHDSVRNGREDIVARPPLKGFPMNIVDLTGTYCPSMKNSDNSRFNIVSAIVSLSMALEALGSGETSIGIITPYAAQTRLIQAMIQDIDPDRKWKDNISCATVHQFQGSERNLIIFDAVESYPSTRAGWLLSRNENGSLMRLMNVAITRARGKFIAVADSRFWITKYREKQNEFFSLLAYLMKRGNTMKIRDYGAHGYVEDALKKGPVRSFISLDDAMKSLRQDFLSVRQRIIISIPDGALDQNTQKEIFQWITEARIRGVTVLIKSNDYTSLPDQWKSYAWGTENAVFPLIIFDDKTVWYGLPLSKGRFVDKNSTFSTVHPLVIRITGKKTIDLIRSLSDIETRQINGKRASFTEKTARDAGGSEFQEVEDTGKQAGGLARYLSQKEFCYKCKSPMKMVKGKRSSYLRCPKCDEKRWIDVRQIQLYIDMENVRCPKDKCDLEAKIGKFGLYIQCQAGHTLKIEEI